MNKKLSIYEIRQTYYNTLRPILNTTLGNGSCTCLDCSTGRLGANIPVIHGESVLGYIGERASGERRA